MTFRALFAAFVVTVLISYTALADGPTVGSLVSAQVHYTSGILIASNKAGTAAIHFTTLRADGGLDYEFRYRPNASATKEQTGTGTVSPVTPKPTTRPTVKTGLSGQTKDDIVAGDLALLWGKGGDEWGWVHYVPEEMTVQVVFLDFKEFKEMDLERFQK